MRPSTLGVIGLGAIGGSLARQATEAGVAVIGWSPDASEREAARRAGAVGEAPAQAADVARRADLLVLAAPPAANLSLLETLHSLVPPHALVTDVGSVKRAIVSRAEAMGFAARFVGSHPLAGTHAHGFAASRPDLFRGALVYITPTAGGAQAAQAVADFWQSVCGAHPRTLDPAAHDAEIAMTSHLPQVIASLLGGYLATHLARNGPATALGPGARDTTRLAASEPALWTEILLMNRDELLPALRALEEPLGEIEQALEQGSAAAVLAWLDRAAQWRRSIDA